MVTSNITEAERQERKDSMNEQLIQDVLFLIGKCKRPVLFNDLVGSLRRSFRNDLSYSLPNGRRWKNINEQALKTELRDWGFHFGGYRHGSGLAVYVYTEPFNEIVNGRGKIVATKEL